jgi:Tfp pilus assembly protein PilF
MRSFPLQADHSLIKLCSSGLIALSLILCWASPVFASAYIPASDLSVLERLPFKPNDPLARELMALRTALRNQPDNLMVAVELARRYYEMVGEEGDPRYLGYAQAALTPWWSMPVAPIEVQVLRAGLAQFRHDFPSAITDLGKVLERDPQHQQARILRAIIQIVQARYDLARADCQILKTQSKNLIGLGCEAMVDGLTGKAGPAYASLQSALFQTKTLSTEHKLWVLTRLAELSLRLGKVASSELHFRQALALGVADTFLLAAYADFLLDQKRPTEVVALLKEKTRSDTLLLRLVFAERDLGLASAKEREATLAARYLAAQLRGDTVHQQEEARFALRVQADPSKALALAKENWKVQREPRDARIFLEAALASKNPNAAIAVLDWLQSSHIEDPYLRSLERQVKVAQK